MIQLAHVLSIKTLHIHSDSFLENGLIPMRYTCDGLNVSPSLTVKFIPSNAISLVIIMEDPDAPINTWVHWLTWNIPVTQHIGENSKLGIEGLNDFCKNYYCGPCPMAGTHHYVFKVYALDALLNLKKNTKKHELEKAMSSHVVAYGDIVGLYRRNKTI